MEGIEVKYPFLDLREHIQHKGEDHNFKLRSRNLIFVFTGSSAATFHSQRVRENPHQDIRKEQHFSLRTNKVIVRIRAYLVISSRSFQMEIHEADIPGQVDIVYKCGGDR